MIALCCQGGPCLWDTGYREQFSTSNCFSSWSEETKTISKRFPEALIASYACFSRGVNCLHGGHLRVQL